MNLLKFVKLRFPKSMSGTMTASEAAKKWGISVRRVRWLCQHFRVYKAMRLPNGNTLIDQAEEQVSASTEATACDNLGQKLQERTDKELKDAPDYTPALEASDGEIPSEVPEKTASEPTVAAEEVVADEEFTHEEALAFQASLKKLINIAHTVKMSKDLPASKKEEVLARIQKASEKFINAVREDKKKVN